MLRALILTILMLLSAPAHAAMVEYIEQENSIYIAGELRIGDSDKVLAILEKLDAKPILVVNSIGGVFTEGMAIGIMAYAFQLDFYAADQCHSSCAYAALGAHNIFVMEDTEMTLHLPYYPVGNTDYIEQLGNVMEYFDLIDVPMYVRARFAKLVDTKNNREFDFDLLLGE